VDYDKGHTRVALFNLPRCLLERSLFPYLDDRSLFYYSTRTCRRLEEWTHETCGAAALSCRTSFCASVAKTLDVLPHETVEAYRGMGSDRWSGCVDFLMDTWPRRRFRLDLLRALADAVRNNLWRRRINLNEGEGENKNNIAGHQGILVCAQAVGPLKWHMGATWEYLMRAHSTSEDAEANLECLIQPAITCGTELDMKRVPLRIDDCRLSFQLPVGERLPQNSKHWIASHAHHPTMDGTGDEKNKDIRDSKLSKHKAPD
jgi:hypothetical protein